MQPTKKKQYKTKLQKNRTWKKENKINVKKAQINIQNENRTNVLWVQKKGNVKWKT